MSNSSRYSRHPEEYIRTLRWQADKADGERRLKSVTSQVNSLDWALFQALAKELGISASWLLHTALTEFLTSGRKLPPAPEVIDKTIGFAVKEETLELMRQCGVSRRQLVAGVVADTVRNHDTERLIGDAISLKGEAFRDTWYVNVSVNGELWDSFLKIAYTKDMTAREAFEQMLQTYLKKDEDKEFGALLRSHDVSEKRKSKEIATRKETWSNFKARNKAFHVPNYKTLDFLLERWCV